MPAEDPTGTPLPEQPHDPFAQSLEAKGKLDIVSHTVEFLEAYTTELQLVEEGVDRMRLLLPDYADVQIELRVQPQRDFERLKHLGDSNNWAARHAMMLRQQFDEIAENAKAVGIPEIDIAALLARFSEVIKARVAAGDILDELSRKVTETVTREERTPPLDPSTRRTYQVDVVLLHANQHNAIITQMIALGSLPMDASDGEEIAFETARLKELAYAVGNNVRALREEFGLLQQDAYEGESFPEHYRRLKEAETKIHAGLERLKRYRILIDSNRE
jgi:hypothetical protein